MPADNAPTNGYDDGMSPKTPTRKAPSKRTVGKRKPAQTSAAAAQPGEHALLRWLKDRNITEVECLVPDITGNARGKIIPAHKFSPICC
jgi:glutamine synthetase